MSLVLLPHGSEDLFDGLAASEPKARASHARRCGRPDFEVAVPLLEVGLLDSDIKVRQAAAEALGRIGGGRSSDALLTALRAGQLPPGRLARELARSAPDFYLEMALVTPENRSVRAPLAIAAGLRGRATAIDALLPLLRGDEAERAAAAHALGGLGDTRVMPVLKDTLDDSSPAVNAAVERALTRLRPRPRGNVAKPASKDALWRRMLAWLQRGSRRS
jgi:HEAT repeat protein